MRPLTQPALPEESPLGHREQLVTIRIGAEEFALPVGQAREIVPYRRVTRVPGAAYQFAGVMNLRGDVIPVVEPKRRMGVPEREPDEATCIIVLDAGDHDIGLMVDAVREVVAIDPACVQPPAGAMAEVPYLVGVVELAGRLVGVVDPEAMIQPPGGPVSDADGTTARESP
jgi:purine-binding chemotaxis protein CheW